MKRASTAASGGPAARPRGTATAPKESLPAAGPSSRATLLAAGVVLLVVFVIYAATACRTVGPGDSGELTTVLSSWGVAHAPGYPLFSLLGNLVSRLPFPGEPAFLLNLFTAFLGALSASVLAMAVIEATRDVPAGVTAGLALGASRVFWEYSLVVEVFALNSLFASLLLFLLARFLRGLSERRPVYWPLPSAALVASTVLTHHLTLALLAIPVLLVFLFALFRERAMLDPARLRKAMIAALLAGAAGLLPLLYVPLAARGNPVLSWDDATTFRNFKRLLLREDFGSGTLMSPWAVAQTVLEKGVAVNPLGGRHFSLFWAEIPRNFEPFFTLVAAIGVVAAFRRHCALLFLLGLFAAMLLVFFLRVNTPVLPLYQGVTERFHIMPHVVVAFFGGLGLAFLSDILFRRKQSLRLLPAAAALVAVAMAAVQHGGHVSMRGNTFTGDFGANLLEGIPENAIVLSEGDLFHNAFYYQQVVLGKRPDLEFVDQQKLTYPWYVNQVRRRGRMELPDGMTFYSADPATHTKSWLDLNIRERGRPVVAVTVKDQSWFPEYRLVPMGLWYHVLPVESLPALAEQAAAFEKVAASWNLRSLNKEYHDRSWEAAERPLYARALGLLAGTLDLAEDLATGRTDFVPDSHAASWLERAGSVSGGERDYVPAAHVEVYHRAIAEQMDLSAVGGAAPVARKALAIAERALVENPRNVAVLKSQVALLRAFPESMDKGRELEIRGRIADLVPGDVNEVAAYVQLAIDLLNDPALRNVVDRGALVRRQEELVRRLELAAKVSRDPLLEKQRDQWREYLSRTRSMPG